MDTITKFEVGKTYSGYVTICGQIKKPCVVTKKRTPSFFTFAANGYTLKGKVCVMGGAEQVRNREISISSGDLVV